MKDVLVHGYAIYSEDDYPVSHFGRIGTLGAKGAQEALDLWLKNHDGYYDIGQRFLVMHLTTSTIYFFKLVKARSFVIEAG